VKLLEHEDGRQRQEVTGIVRLRVKPGHNDELHQWLDSVGEVSHAAAFSFNNTMSRSTKTKPYSLLVLSSLFGMAEVVVVGVLL